MPEPVSMDASAFPFDHGVVVGSGGFRFSLLRWREYYTNNVIFTKALTHEAFCAEFPEAAEALAESDRKSAWLKENDLSGVPLMDVLEKLAQAKSGKQVKVTADMVREADAPPPAVKEHMHAWGEGETGKAEGHTHKIVNGECVETMGHTHDAPAAAKADDAGEKQED